MRLLSNIRNWFSSPEKERAQALYIALVAQSRKPFFFADCAVPDSLDGRFEIILLHLFMALRNGLPGERHRLLLEYFFDDMDRSLREMGVGDMGVSKRVRRMAEAAFGRLKAYQAASSGAALKEALCKNVYAGAVSEPALEKLLAYVQAPLPETLSAAA